MIGEENEENILFQPRVKKESSFWNSFRNSFLFFLQTHEGNKALNKIIGLLTFLPFYFYFYYHPEKLGNWIGSVLRAIQTHLIK